jgi:hypothetical protein
MSEDPNASGPPWIVLTCVAATFAGALFIFIVGGGLGQRDIWAEDYAGEAALAAPPGDALLVEH